MNVIKHQFIGHLNDIQTIKLRLIHVGGSNYKQDYHREIMCLLIGVISHKIRPSNSIYSPIIDNNYTRRIYYTIK